MVASNKNMILCSPNDQPIAQLNGLRIDSVSYTEPLKDYKTLEFVVDKYIDIDGKYQLSNGYDNIAVYMEIYIDGLGYFQLQEPSINNDGYKESKTCVAYSIEKELEGKDLVGFLINQGTKDSMEYLATNNIDDLGFAKEYITFYNTSNKELSLMDLVLEQLPGWSIGYIDPQLKTKKLAFNEDSINIYAFLCSEVAPKAECIFVFDNTDRIINAYGKDSIGENTNVFISFRNLLKSVDIICDEDSVVTRFAVSGADNLDIRNVNFNDRRILNLDYFMREPYMAGDLVQKLQTWISYRDGKRSDYVDLTRQYLDLESKMYEIQYRLPLDGCDWEQWDSMDKESLEKNLKYYNALLTDLQVSVDPNPQYTTDADGNKTYIPWKDSSGNVDHQRYLDLLYKQTNGYGGYYTYYEVKEYIIPNIETAISNLDLPEDQKAEYNKDYETNWDLYGTVELTAKKEFYEKQVLEVLADYEKPWSELTEEEQSSHSAGEAAYNIQHNKYVEYKEYLGDEETEGSLLYTLKKLNDELASLKTQQENIGTQRTDMISDVSMSNSRFGFSSNDIIIINRLFHDTDYTNENILTTSIDTTLTTLDVQEDLYQDAISKLSECSQPQYNFTIEVENLLSIEEFKDWNSEFINGNYFMLGISDDYAVKLRLVSRSWNPCDITPDLTVEFSNMILSKDGRSDISYLFDEINRAAKNAINIGSGNAKDSLELSTEILQKLINSQAFHNAVTDITADNAEITNIVAEYIEASEIKVDKITGTEAEFDTLFSKYIDADYINARVIIAENGEFQQLSADVANLKNAVIGTSSTETGIIINLSATNAKIDSAWIADLVAKEITVGDLKAGDIVVSDAVRIISQNENGGNLTLNGSTMQFTDKNGNVGIQIGYGNSDTPHLLIQDENGTALWTSQGITDAAIADGLIVNDMIGDTTITKEKLAFNTVETDEDGNVSINNIVANGEKFSVQYDTFKSNTESALESLSNASDSIELTGEQVFTVTNDIISPSSITISAICHNNATIDKWFVDDVENTSYVASDKLSLTIPSSYMANRKSATIKAQNANGTLYDIFTVYKVVDGKDGSDGKDGADNIRVEITSSEGEIFKSDTTTSQTTLTCYVYKGSTEITPDSYIWMKKTDDGEFVYTGITTKSITVDLSNFSVIEKYKCQINIAVEDEKVISVDENGTLNVEQNTATIDENGILVYSQTPSIDENGTLFFES